MTSCYALLHLHLVAVQGADLQTDLMLPTKLPSAFLCHNHCLSQGLQVNFVLYP